MDGTLTAFLLLTCIILGVLAYLSGILDLWGSVSASVVAFVIGVCGDASWLMLLLFFLLTSFAATKYKYTMKRSKGLSEGKEGERHGHNVLANGIIPMVVAIFSFDALAEIGITPIPKEVASVLFICAVAVAASDTVASEMGVCASRPRMITNPRRVVKPGTSGGVSLPGLGWALAASAYTAIAGWLFMVTMPSLFPGSAFANTLPANYLLVTLPLSIGFLGCQIDSLLGATVEQKGWLSSSGVNMASIGLATAIGALIFMVI